MHLRLPRRPLHHRALFRDDGLELADRVGGLASALQVVQLDLDYLHPRSHITDAVARAPSPEP